MGREKEREEKHEIERLRCEDFIYNGTCNSRDHFKPTARTQKIGDVRKSMCGTISDIHSFPQHSQKRGPTFSGKQKLI